MAITSAIAYAGCVANGGDSVRLVVLSILTDARPAIPPSL